MLLPYLGELTSLIASLMFALSPTFFTLGAQGVGSMTVNRTRLLLAVIFLLIAHSIVMGIPLPFSAAIWRWLWLAASGVVSLGIGNSAAYQAFLLIGTRLTVLIFNSAPIFSVLFGWIFLGEELSGWQLVGILITMGGIFWVVAERRVDDNGEKLEDGKRFGLGILLALMGAVGHSLGLLASKIGLAGDFSVISGQIIRMLSGAIFIWVITVIQGEVRLTFRKLGESPLAFRQILIGTVAGPFIGVWFSLMSIQLIDLGVASTLQSLSPIYLLPIGYIVFKERIRWRAVIGTVLALIGVAVLFLVK
jgi:drug/metabolite transporter (DMT)-like permease